MADPFPAERTVLPSPGDSARAIGRLGAARGVRGYALLGPGGVLAASGPEARWEQAGRALLEAADRAAGVKATHAHVATEEGETFAVRSGELALVAVTDRFTLASLVFADMRAALRDARAAARPVDAAEAA
jgi:hypothetical protein